jgi:DNA-binding transcriptional regulator YdaS (Cro superfamily)
MAVPNATLQKLETAAAAAGLDQGRWAAMAGLNRSRLNQAIHGRVDLQPNEMQAVRDALKAVLDERVQTFNKFLNVDLAAAVA